MKWQSCLLNIFAGNFLLFDSGSRSLRDFYTYAVKFKDLIVKWQSQLVIIAEVSCSIQDQVDLFLIFSSDFTAIIAFGYLSPHHCVIMICCLPTSESPPPHTVRAQYACEIIAVIYTRSIPGFQDAEDDRSSALAG